MPIRAISLAALALPLVFFSVQAARAVDRAELQRAADELGITLSDELLTSYPVIKQLGALARERCDQQAAYQLSKALEEESYRREAAESLVGFSKRCGGYANGIRRAINVLLDISDYPRSIELAGQLIEMEPNDDNGYFLRAVAYDRNNQCDKAIADYSSAIELFGDKDKISSVSYDAMSQCYEKLGQYCDAMVPIESWVAIDPNTHDNDQTRSILKRLSSKGECAAETKAGRKGETFKRKGSNVIRVEASINGTKGTFIVDTGASYVTVKKRFAEKVGVALAGERIRLNTANGTVDGFLTKAKAVKLRSLEAQGVQLVIQVDDHADFGDGIHGLIGMSFLSRFDVAMDSKSLRIRPRKTR